MNAGDLVRLVGQRAVRTVRRLYDEKAGWTSQQQRQQEWARRWVALGVAFPDWLERASGGRFWLTSRSAPRWARRFCSEADLTTARQVVAGRYSLLGVDDAEMGSPPHWRRDWYSGTEWPLAKAAHSPLMLGDGSDIRTLWELSRGYYFVSLAKAYWRTGERAFLAAFQAHVESWIAENPPGWGPNWMSPMDGAIRAANWILAALLFAAAGLPASFWAGLLANLRLTAWFIERNPEWHPRFRGNHFVSNGVGLVYLGALFRDDPDGARWLRAGAGILEREMEYQVCPDGVSFEAAIGYHRLVTELFSFGGELADQNRSRSLGPAYWARLTRMYGFIACYLPAGGDAPLLGDADDGRLHAWSAGALERPRQHRLGLRRRYWPRGEPASAAFPNGGFYVIRGGGAHTIIRCGPVGLKGGGSHDHNDQLSFELTVGSRPLITDSGTYAYTRDLEERFRFRSTAAHNVPQLAGEEQNPMTPSRPWRVLADRTRSECTEWNADPRGARFTGRHRGYAHRASRALCWRSLVADFAAGRWRMEDRIEGCGSERVSWRLHFAPGELACRQLAPGHWSLTHSSIPEVTLTLQAGAALSLELATSRLSERYGHWVWRPLLELTGVVDLPLTVTLELNGIPR